MRLIRTGATRLVITTTNYAIKFPNFSYSWRHFIRGILANIMEVELFTISSIEGSYSQPVANYLCPIIWSSWGCWIVIMEKALVLEEYPDGELQEFRRIIEPVTSDIKADNIGILNGKLVCIDYGYSETYTFNKVTKPVS